MYTRIIIISFILINSLFSQFNDINITFDYNDMVIKNNKKYILEEFNEKITNYFKYTKFVFEYDYLEIELNFHIFYHSINFVDENNYEGLNCQFFISNQNGQYYITKEIYLPYYKGKDLFHNPSNFDEISSLLDFYAYAFIADELDTYNLYLGDNYYNSAIELTKIRRNKNKFCI